MPDSRPLAMPVFAGFTAEQLRSALVFVMFACSFVVFIEPAPVDLIFIVVLLSFLNSGLSPTIGAAPLVLLLILYSIGGFMSLMMVASDDKARMFVLTSTYMAIAAVFVAYYVAHDPVRRFKVIRAGFIVAGILAAFFGMLDYLDIGGLFLIKAVQGRATGTFKDPNVFSTYLIFPGLLLIQGLMLGKARHPLMSTIGLLTILSGIFFSFSRGAWISFVAAALLLAGLTFILNSAAALRRRIVTFLIAGFFVAFFAFTVLMSVESVRDMFFMRFSLLQSYDAGETGRFGDQINSIPMLMERPLGFGPLQFRNHFGNDPHSSFINAFSSYGWLGGIAYITLILTTLAIGLKAVFTRTPWQNDAIVVFCPLATTILQSVQIDIDHWRHFYWLLGLMWGIFAASLQPSQVVGAARDAFQLGAKVGRGG